MLLKELKYVALCLILFVLFVKMQDTDQRKTQKRNTRKKITDGEGVKKKIIPI